MSVIRIGKDGHCNRVQPLHSAGQFTSTAIIRTLFALIWMCAAVFVFTSCAVLTKLQLDKVTKLTTVKFVAVIAKW